MFGNRRIPSLTVMKATLYVIQRRMLINLFSSNILMLSSADDSKVNDYYRDLLLLLGPTLLELILLDIIVEIPPNLELLSCLGVDIEEI